MDKYHVGIDLAKGDDLGCCVIKKGATLLAEFFGPRCEEQALQWLLTRMDATDAGLAAAQRELAAWQKAVDDYNDPRVQHIAAAWWIKNRVAELLAQEGGKPHVNVGTLGHVDHGKTALTAALTKVGTQPQYRELTIEDADELCKMFSEWRGLNLSRGMIGCLKQLNFVRKVQP